MKKAIKTLAIAAVLTTLLVCSAFAAAGTNTPEWTSAVADGCSLTHVEAAGTTPAHYKVTYNTNLVEGNQYALLVVKKDTSGSYTVSENTIMYIDQMATSNGVSFDFIPKSTPDCIVLLGGIFADGVKSPIKLGELIGKGVQVTGSVSYLGTVTTPVVTLTAGTNTYTATVTAPTNGTATYTFDSIPDGTYTLKITKIGHLPYSKNITIDASSAAIPAIALLGGDVDGDHQYINTGDLSALLTDFKKEEAVKKATNINEDEYVNVEDLSTILTNYKKSY